MTARGESAYDGGFGLRPTEANGERASSTYGWPLHVIDEAGHVPHVERPGAFLGALAVIEPALRGGKAETT